MLGQVLFALASVLGVRLLTELLTPAAYGELALALTLVTLAQQTGFGPLSAAISRLYPRAITGGGARSLGAAVSRSAVGVGLAFAAMGGTVAIVALVTSANPRFPFLFAVASLVGIAAGIDSNAEALGTAARKRIQVSMHQAMRGLLRFGAAAVGAAIHPSSIGALLGYLAGTVVTSMSHVHFTSDALARGHSSDSEQVARFRADILRYGWPFVAWGMFTWLQFASDRWALEVFASTDQVGLYNALFQIGFYPVTLVSTVIITYAQPILFQRFEEDRGDAFRWCLRGAVLLAVLTLVATAVMYAFHGIVGGLLLGPEFRGTSNYLPWMVLAAGLYAAGQGLALGPLLLGRSRSLLWPILISTSTGTLLTFWLANLWGLPGVVLANCLYGAGHVLVMGHQYWRSSIVAKHGP